MAESVPPQSLILVHFVEQQLEGWTFARSHWPLHITLVPWFRVEDEEAVIRALERMAGTTDAINLRVGDEDKFGVNADVPVNLIANQKPVKRLHAELMDTLSEADVAYHEPHFIREHYAAHITRHVADKRHSNKGEEIFVDNFHVLRLITSDLCRVEQRFALRRR